MYGTDRADAGRGQDLTREGAFAHVRSTTSPLWSAARGGVGAKSYATKGYPRRSPPVHPAAGPTIPW